MARMSLKDLMSNDVVTMGVFVPITAAGYTWVMTAAGVGAAAAFPIAVPLAGATVGVLEGMSGARESRGMTDAEIKEGLGISTLAAILVWAAGEFGAWQPAQALLKAADDTAKAASTAAKNPVGGSIFGALSYAAVLVSGFFLAYGLKEWLADEVSKA